MPTSVYIHQAYSIMPEYLVQGGLATVLFQQRFDLLAQLGVIPAVFLQISRPLVPRQIWTEILE